ncbi:TonB-dependent receptor [Indibacter alkaliphilus LW1]|uniref:TonB-dependent receptor n=1 Tax=Indibacter alkaliphilus (strain CCUG 57479 / KCTC 22604 / LW1) TaxID=1189612 RepID=S2CYF3_INDAL|nr:TonB-dependent receptor [Indibacter alkaliphilus]EOZ91599.1 TonB-dependent receptor [Indibacter alkaliphilus LW1]
MYKTITIFLMLFLHVCLLMAQQEKMTLSGYVRDASTGEELLGATVLIRGTSEGAVTNLYGFYSISIRPDQYYLQVSYMGFESKTIEIELQADLNLSIELMPSNLSLEMVEVSAIAKDEKILEIGSGIERVSMEQMRKMPKLLGEVDLIRNIQLLPGISTVGEGTSGFNVRGGGADENLILLDEAVVFNAAHVMGFFSVFNSDAIKDVKIYKGGLPAQYGGRLSSVLDVRQLEGNSKKLQVKGGIGLLSSRLTVEGPIQKDKTSFLLAGRRSYMDVFTKLSGDEELKNNNLYFYDFNAKVNHKFSDKDRIFLSYYSGKDVMKLGDLFSSSWGNNTMTFRWNHVFNPRLFTNITVTNSNYFYHIIGSHGPDAWDWKSSILNQTFKADAAYFVNPNRTIDFGLQSNMQDYVPGTIVPTSEESAVNFLEMAKEHAIESGAYVSWNEKINEQWKFEVGLRYVDFRRLGGTQYIYQDGVMERDAIIDSVSFSRHQTMARYNGLEPRFNLSFTPNKTTAIKASFHRANQFVHLISNTNSPSPIDVWKPSNAYLKPAQVDQVSLGLVRGIQNNNFELVVEGYYKDYRRVLDFKDGARLTFNETLETEVLEGIGRAYGLEASVEKKEGRFTGRISYTLSRSERKVNGINQGEWYRANFDKPHDLSIYGLYQLNKKWDFSANFVLASGRPFTQPIGKYEWEGMILPVIGERNAHRIPTYHRLDISANLNPEGKRGSWSFGLYNVYARRNAYSIFFRQQEASPQTEAVRLSILGSVIPSVTYNFKF